MCGQRTGSSICRNFPLVASCPSSRLINKFWSTLSSQGAGEFGAAVTPHAIIKHAGEAVSHSTNQPNTIREKPEESRVLHKQTSALIRLHLMCKFFSILILAIWLRDHNNKIYIMHHSQLSRSRIWKSGDALLLRWLADFFAMRQPSGLRCQKRSNVNLIHFRGSSVKSSWHCFNWWGFLKVSFF